MRLPGLPRTKELEVGVIVEVKKETLAIIESHINSARVGAERTREALNDAYVLLRALRGEDGGK